MVTTALPSPMPASAATAASSAKQAAGKTPVRKHHHGHLQYVTTSRKTTTRHMAALDFLLNVPMQKENAIRETGLRNLRRSELSYSDSNPNSNPNEEDAQDIRFATIQEEMATLSLQYQDAPGRKLQGQPAACVRVPPYFRHFLARTSQQSAVVRQWEDLLLLRGPAAPSAHAQPLLGSRHFFSRARAYPVLISSIIKYDAGEEKAKVQKQRAEDSRGDEVYQLPDRDWRGFSYKGLFKPMVEELADSYFFDRGFIYDPNIIDDPNMLYGEHRYVLHRSATTGPLMSSVILFVNETDLEKSLNDQFREDHPHLPPSLTLSKIREAKKEALILGQKLNLEVATIAIAVICFERLCLKGIVTKYNRLLSMAVSLLLAYKFNETVSSKYHQKLSSLLDYIDHQWEISRKEVFEAEFGAYVQLGFSMHIPHQHVVVVFTHLLRLLHIKMRAYLGDEMTEICNAML